MTAAKTTPISGAPARLTRSAVALSTPPERIVHLGLGAFHRAHQAWYTAHAPDAHEWGIVAFSGRSRDLVDRLSSQEGVFTLITRGADGDRFEVVPSIVRVEAGDDVSAFVAAVANPSVAILTMTITEAGYRVDAAGSPDLTDPDVVADIGLLRETLGADPDATGVEPNDVRPVTALGRVLLALDARRRSGGGPIALISCDNLPNNGGLLEHALLDLADRLSIELATWMRRAVSVVSTSVDRITPAVDAAAESAVVAESTGWLDAAPVVTEEFSDWVLSGDFPAGRPNWEAVGARFVDDLEPWENRKLWMLNGAHTVLAVLGQARGHSVVSEAIDDSVCFSVVEGLWDDDARQLPGFNLADYRAALIDRFRNPRIEHRLAQIALDSTTKMRLRVVPVAQDELTAGREAAGCAAAIAAWTLGVQSGFVPDPRPLGRRHVHSDQAAPADLLLAMNPGLAADPGFAESVLAAHARLAASIPTIPTPSKEVNSQ